MLGQFPAQGLFAADISGVQGLFPAKADFHKLNCRIKNAAVEGKIYFAALLASSRKALACSCLSRSSSLSPHLRGTLEPLGETLA